MSSRLSPNWYIKIRMTQRRQSALNQLIFSNNKKTSKHIVDFGVTIIILKHPYAQKLNKSSHVEIRGWCKCNFKDSCKLDIGLYVGGKAHVVGMFTLCHKSILPCMQSKWSLLSLTRIIEIDPYPLLGEPLSRKAEGTISNKALF